MAGYNTVPQSAQLQPEEFQVAISEQELSDFKDLLRLSKIAPRTYENTQADGKYGVTHEWMSQVKKYWETEYDWRAREKYINSFPNFTVDIEDDDGEQFRLHFAALFSKKQDAVPLLFMHGWPGSHLEFLSVMGLFRERYTPDELPYHIIVPSLPGYTLSSGPPLTRDFQLEDIARIMNKLMVGLGFGSGYIAQGGDIGSFVSKILAANHGECKGIHLNCSPDYKKPDSAPDHRAGASNDAEEQGLKRLQEFLTNGGAYSQEHGTRPATIGFVLSSSPLALLAWIGEKFIDWTDETPPLTDILDAATLYWFTQSFPRCIYPYREFTRPGALSPHSNPKFRSDKPVGYSWFPQEVTPVPKSWAAAMGNLVWHRQHDSGGHFPALEKPDLLLRDVEDFVKQIWPVE